MTIKNYTFLSPTGTEFPVSATADRRLYLMLGGMNYSDYKMKHWGDPLNTALNRVYSDTSFVLGGAYFEIQNHAITLNANTTNFVHVNIDLSNVSEPVAISVETSENSNTVDINTSSGVLKKCIEIITTSGNEIIKIEEVNQDSDLIKQLKLAMNPIGTVLTTTNSANPSTYIGGIWERFAKGRTLVGVNESDSALSTANKAGGSTNPLSEHNHPLRMLQNGASAQTASTGVKYGLQFSDDKFWRIGDLNLCDETNNSGPSGQTGGIAKTKGNNANHANWQPFTTVYYWRRIA